MSIVTWRNYPNMPNAKFIPTWGQYEEAANNQTDAKAALKASDAFEEERAKEMRNSKKARDWETSRKASIMREKPRWVKKQRKEEAEVITRELAKFKQAGVFDYDVEPMPGYILVRVESLQKNVSGIVLAESDEPNTGIVVKASDDQLTVVGDTQILLKCPVQAGDKIMFKKYAGAGIAGLEIRSKENDYRLMRWSYSNDTNDLLAKLT